MQPAACSAPATCHLGAEAAAVAEPVVSRHHLQRQLKVWVDEGRLEKAGRNCFTLPEQRPM
jgi:hypothetical protein